MKLSLEQETKLDEILGKISSVREENIAFIKSMAFKYDDNIRSTQVIAVIAYLIAEEII